MSTSDLLLWTRSHDTRKYAIAVLSVTTALILLVTGVASGSCSRFTVFLRRDAQCMVWWIQTGITWRQSSLRSLSTTTSCPPSTHWQRNPGRSRVFSLAVSALVVGTLSAAQRSAAESLGPARDDLIGTVQELQTANQALQTRASTQARRRQTAAQRGIPGGSADAQPHGQLGIETCHWRDHVLFRGMLPPGGLDPQVGQLRYETFFQRVHPDDQPRLSEAVEASGRKNADFELDYRIIHPSGEIRDIHVLGHPVLNPSGGPVEYVGTVMDVTERRRAEEAREIASDAGRSRTGKPGDHYGRADGLPGTRSQSTDCRALTNANTCLLWLARDTPDSKKRVRPP